MKIAESPNLLVNEHETEEEKEKKRKKDKQEILDRIYENWIAKVHIYIYIYDRMKVDFHGVDVRLIIYALSGVDGLMVIKEGVLRVAHMHFHGQRGCAFLRAKPV